MKCPSCTTTALVMTDRSNIEIDYCPDCRGVWLDRGELDKIIERVVPAARPADPPVPATSEAFRVDSTSRIGTSRRDWDDDDDDDDRRRSFGDGRSGGKRKSKSKGFLGELFEF